MFMKKQDRSTTFEDSDEIITTDKVHNGTLTEHEDRKPLECRFCVHRLSKLRKLEKLTSMRGSDYSLTHGQYPSDPNQPRQDKECQTSASLFERAEMTRQEFRTLAMFLGLQEEKLLSVDAFCKCIMEGQERDCRCGEDNKYFEWVWDHIDRGNATSLQEQGNHVVFHKDFSCGTTAVRGLQAMDKDQHFWEIKMTTPVYGTDMMIGVGTSDVELNKYHNTFCSMLGFDTASWGISYDGQIQHAGEKQQYCNKFGQGTIIGVHLDMWHGTLTFFKNRQSLGVAFKGLRGKTLYPMASSTAAKSGMRVISSHSFSSSLQFLCCQKLRQLIPAHLSILDVLPMPPGLRLFLANNVAWFLRFPHANPPKSSRRYICHICMPLKSALEECINDEDGNDEHHFDNYEDAKDTSDKSCLNRAPGRSLRYPIMASCSDTHSLRIRSGLSRLPSTSLSASSSQSNSESVRAAHPTTADVVKKVRLDGDISQDEDKDDDEEENIGEEDGNERSDVYKLIEEGNDDKQLSTLGKRKRT